VERLTFDPEKIDDEALWYCLACQECTFFCPSGVYFQSFMTDLRVLLLEKGHKEYALFCTICGRYLMPKKEFEYLPKGPEGKRTGELLSVCPQCKKNDYLETLHRLARWPKFRR
jgi:Fe-S oxidoreductase